ncbi:hypothetical protein V1520DRAFT_343021 [Lipomyces starkeyi]|uniref:Mitochondrial intermembrane space import and assembly protein 40 n=1 Tax=Lipomyces starkeyi NRRL Y-11557 TaxID=675824 RepID=A0A1E3PX67_LIPST|nr:hypothetical protein LIPSTDRAFT_107761 [Lipomyces starkeyi NRRL Y-11557]
MIRPTLIRHLVRSAAAASSARRLASSKPLASINRQATKQHIVLPVLLAAAGFGIFSILFDRPIAAEATETPVESATESEPVVDASPLYDPLTTPVPHLAEDEIQQSLDTAVAQTAVELGPDSIDASSTAEDEEYGAYNPRTGEINWDCPCLGGMAHGPCGEEFKAAFSCFVFSEEEPKGVNCVPLFEVMQNCFRKYPETYAEDLRYIDERQQEEAGTAVETAAAPSPTPSA